MSDAGRPTTLDDGQRDVVCSLVAAGVSIRQAAHFVDTTPRTIQRDAQRNDLFRRRLIQAKSEVSVHPLRTLREAARTNWRAALCVVERLNPEQFANPSANVVTQSEANQFVTHLVAAIEEGVSNQKERAAVFKLLSVAMPAAMRRCWNKRTTRSKVEWAIGESEHQKQIEELKQIKARRQRDERRWALLREMRNHLPDALYKKIAWDDPLLDPEPPLASPPAVAPKPSVSEDPAPSASPLAPNANIVPPEMNNDAPPATKSTE